MNTQTTKIFPNIGDVVNLNPLTLREIMEDPVVSEEFKGFTRMYQKKDLIVERISEKDDNLFYHLSCNGIMSPDGYYSKELILAKRKPEELWDK